MPDTTTPMQAFRLWNIREHLVQMENDILRLRVDADKVGRIDYARILRTTSTAALGIHRELANMAADLEPPQKESER